MNKKREIGGKGVSPVIATVLLIGMVIVIALIIFLWVQELGGESITKFDGKNIEIVCEDVEFDAEYAGGQISVSNTGVVPIFNFRIKVVEGGSYSTVNIFEFSDWPNTGLAQGSSFRSIDSSTKIPGNPTKLVLAPVLMGKSSKGERTYACKEKTYGKEIVL